MHGGGERYIDVDNRGGARAATEHLLSTGRERIAALAPEAHIVSAASLPTRNSRSPIPIHTSGMAILPTFWHNGPCAWRHRQGPR